MLYVQIHVIVIPNAKKPEIREEEGKLVVKVDAPPVGGKANKRLIEILAKYYRVKKSKIRIVHGEYSRNKLIEVDMGGE